jgi:hypothetical protein
MSDDMKFVSAVSLQNIMGLTSFLGRSVTICIPLSLLRSTWDMVKCVKVAQLVQWERIKTPI